MRHSHKPGVALSDAPSGFRQLLGYRVTEWSEGAATVELTIGPRHLNRSDIVHGGVVATLIDTAGAYAGTHCAIPGRVRRTLSLGLSCKFLETLNVGTIAAQAQIKETKGDTFSVVVEVFGENDALVATGEASYRYTAGSEKPEGVALDKNGEKRSTSLG